MKSDLPPEIQQLFRSLRRKIRFYLACEGAWLCLFRFGLIFWFLFFSDRFFEFTPTARLILMASWLIFELWDLICSVFVPVFRSLSDHAMAILLERRFPQFNDALLTLTEPEKKSGTMAELASETELEADEPASWAHREMLLAQTREELAAILKTFRFRPVFRLRPLILAFLAALLVWGSVNFLGYSQPQLLSVWVNRFLCFSETPWPRLVQIEMDPAFRSGTLKIARGSDLRIHLRAGVTAPDRHLSDVLRAVYFSYRTEDGICDRIAMERENETFLPEGEWADFSYSFRGVLKSFNFDVTAGDAAVRDLRVEVVESPSLSLSLRLEFPPYAALTPQNVKPGAVYAVPAGTVVTIFGEANKPLQFAELQITSSGRLGAITDLSSNLQAVPASQTQDSAQTLVAASSLKLRPLPGKPNQIHFSAGVFEDDTTLLLTLHDTDGITSPVPLRLVLVREEDALPSVAVNPWGIGEAVTPNAWIPMKGKISDDYGLKSVSYVYQTERIAGESEGAEDLSAKVGEEIAAKKSSELSAEEAHKPPSGQLFLKNFPDSAAPPLEFLLDGASESAFDLAPLGLREHDRFQLSMAAEDRNDLPMAGKRQGRSQPVTLEVVTPEQLRWRLEGREAVLSQLFDAICEEMRDSRETLGSMTFSSEATEAGTSVPDSAAASGDEKTSGETAVSETDADREANSGQESPQALQSYRTERIIQNNRKNSYEFNGIAEGIENVCLQMVHNRIDTPSWFERLESGIRQPLLSVHRQEIPQLETVLTALRGAIEAGNFAQAQSLHADAVSRMDAILLLLASVREKMLKMQDFNEMVELLRTVIRQEEELHAEVARQNRSSLAELLEEDETEEGEAAEEEAKKPEAVDGMKPAEDSKSGKDAEPAEGAQPAADGEKEAPKKDVPEDGTHLSDRQAEILRNFNLWDEKIPQMLEFLRADAARVELLKEARRMSDEMRIRSRMEDAANQLREKSNSKAADGTRSLIPDLKKILARLETENRSQRLLNETERLRGYLKELNQRIREQQSLEGRTRQARDVMELSRDQESNAQKTGELARKVTDDAESDSAQAEDANEAESDSRQESESPKTDPAQEPDAAPSPNQPADSSEKPESDSGKKDESLSERLRRAQERMKEAREKLEKFERDGALEAQKKALQELEEVKGELEQILRQMREEEAKRSLAQMETQLKTLIQLQRGIQDDTKRLDGIPGEKRSQEFIDETTRLSRREKELSVKADSLLTQLREDGRARMITEILTETTADMRQIADLLANGKADAVTLAVEADVLEALEEMLAAVEEAERKIQDDEKQEGEESETAGAEQDPALIDRIAELKMIRSAQLRILRRTQTIGKLISEEETSVPEHLEVLRDLSRQQEKVRKIVHEMAVEEP